MRLRNIPGANEAVASSPYCIQNPSEHRGQWHAFLSDPWPKDRHAKRRLTSRQFLERYDQFLAPDGRIEFKTDNQDLFTFSVEEIEESPIWNLDASTRDLHHDSKMNEGNIMTEYEEKFSSMGNPICKLIASR